MSARDVVIVEAVRTPVGKRDGGLAGVHPVDLSAHVLSSLVERAGVDPALVDDVVWGVGAQVGDQSFNVGRNAVLAAGWPDAVPGTSIDRQCGSSQQAVHFAAAGIAAGQYEVAVAGGVESMSRVPMGKSVVDGDPFGPILMARYEGTPPNQGIGAEMIAERWGLDRTRLDEHALESHARAAAAIDAGRFEGQIAPVTTPDGTVVSVDEGVRRGGTVEGMAGIRSAYREGGLVTAGNASQISDGSAALLLMTAERARGLGLTPIARVHTATVVGDDPVIMLTGPIPATARALERAGLSIDEIGTFEINEAFASVTLAWLAETGADPARVNPDGGAIALGHPIGGSGARLMTTMLHRMREQGIRYGLQSMCEGGGMANATILELL
ncbi:MAG: thiolase family protein [Solirubrobacteraceae bacterium]|nr:thiolase family protein [Solirubrobacteraceae bacterium]